jgi:hypothetical protein
MNIIIFSKDRACQLDLLLRSIKQLWRGWEQFHFNIIWTASTDSFRSGYTQVMTDHPEMFFRCQGDFKKDLCSLINPKKKYSMFFVDDQVMKEPFDMSCLEVEDFKANENIMALSLRLYPGITYCHPRAMTVSVPKFTRNYLWQWEDCQGDWGYPWSIDSSLFRTEDLIPSIFSRPYTNPNNFEDALVQGMTHRPFMTCFEKSKVVNNPCNKVGFYNNRHGIITAESLNDLYLTGKRIDLSPILNMNPVSCHQEFDYMWL